MKWGRERNKRLAAYCNKRLAAYCTKRLTAYCKKLTACGGQFFAVILSLSSFNFSGL